MKIQKPKQSAFGSVPLFSLHSSAPKCVFLETERGMQDEC